MPDFYVCTRATLQDQSTASKARLPKEASFSFRIQVLTKKRISDSGMRVWQVTVLMLFLEKQSSKAGYTLSKYWPSRQKLFDIGTMCTAFLLIKATLRTGFCQTCWQTSIRSALAVNSCKHRLVFQQEGGVPLSEHNHSRRNQCTNITCVGTAIFFFPFRPMGLKKKKKL